MLAAIDAGSNTLRLLVGSVTDGKVVPEFYLRRICRLAGGFSPEEGLSPAARERALFAFQEFAEACRESDVHQVKAVGTAAFRQAINGDDFAREVKAVTGLPLEVVSGETEAAMMTSGVLSALDPMPAHTLIVDIGGGSTEFVLCAGQKALWSCSLPLGVVRLTEGYPLPATRQQVITDMLAGLTAELDSVCTSSCIDASALTLIGTAGTVTTLAALDLQMTEYDWRQVNNYTLPFARLQHWQTALEPLSITARESLPGMEPGRGDLIMAGLEIMLCLMQKLGAGSLTVSDFGILEGLILSLESAV